MAIFGDLLSFSDTAFILSHEGSPVLASPKASEILGGDGAFFGDVWDKNCTALQKTWSFETGVGEIEGPFEPDSRIDPTPHRLTLLRADSLPVECFVRNYSLQFYPSLPHSLTQVVPVDSLPAESAAALSEGILTVLYPAAAIEAFLHELWASRHARYLLAELASTTGVRPHSLKAHVQRVNNGAEAPGVTASSAAVNSSTELTKAISEAVNIFDELSATNIRVKTNGQQPLLIAISTPSLVQLILYSLFTLTEYRSSGSILSITCSSVHSSGSGPAVTIALHREDGEDGNIRLDLPDILQFTSRLYSFLPVRSDGHSGISLRSDDEYLLSSLTHHGRSTPSRSTKTATASANENARRGRYVFAASYLHEVSTKINLPVYIRPHEPSIRFSLPLFL